MADVKFSELTSLAAADVASDDILAIVDTGASTSKKLSIDNLFGAVPVNIAQTDATDATSSAGAVRTAGGVSMAKKLYVGTESTLVGAVTATAGVFPAAQDGAALGSGTLQFSDLFLADAGTITLGDDSDVTLTHVADTGVLLNSTMQLQFGDAGTYIHQSADGVLDLVSDTELELNATTIDVNGTLDLAGATISTALLPNASGTIDLGSTSAEFNDVFLADASVINFGADQDVTLTHVADTGLLLNTGMALRFRDAALEIKSSTDGQLDIDADTELEITSPIVDIDASTSVNISNDLHLDSDSAVLAFGSDQDVTLTHVADAAVMLNTTMALRFRDATLGINSSADGQLDIYSDATVEVTLGGTTPVFAIDGGGAYDAAIKHTRDAQDLTFQQVDGNEVARVTDGAKAVTGFTTVQTAKGGFGYRRQILEFDIGGTDTTSALTTAESGAMVRIDGTNAYNGIITLPAIASDAEAGVWYEFIVTTALQTSKTVKIKTNSHASGTDNDIITLYSFDADSGTAAGVLTATAPSGGNDIITIGAAAAAGTVVKVQNVVGGTAEQWVAYAYVPDSTATTTVGTS